MTQKKGDSVGLQEQIKRDLMLLINEEFGKPKGLKITPELHLLDKGVIDSLSIMTLIVHLENVYNLDFYKIDVTRDSFKSVETIAQIAYENVALREKEHI